MKKISTFKKSNWENVLFALLLLFTFQVSGQIVTNTNDDGPGSLRYVIANDPGSSITFSPSINGMPIQLTSGQITINRNLTIQGNGIGATIIDGSLDNVSRLFQILPGVTVSMSNMTVQNGGSDTYNNNGGAIFSSNSILMIDNCLFQYNRTAQSGGAILNFSGLLSVTSSTFFQNHAGDNINESDFGGAIYSYSADNQTMIESCDFIQNSGSFGGALMEKDGTASVVNSNFSQNSANGGGGAAYGADGGNSSYENCLFANNFCSNGSTIGTGGAFQCSGTGTFSQFTNCQFSGNQAFGTADDGGGTIMIYGGAVNLVHCSIEGGFATTLGGAVRLYNNSCSLTVTNSILWNNYDGSGQNDIANTGGTATASYSLLNSPACPGNVICGAGMIYDQDPLFVDANNNDLHLDPCSPAIDAAAAAGVFQDKDGNARPIGPAFDMGAFEIASGAIYNGNIMFTSQAQLNAFSECVTTINGSVAIQGAGIFDLSPLANVQIITGNLTIQYSGVSNLNGLQGLQTVGGSVFIIFNANLTSLAGLNNQNAVGGHFMMYYNFQLSDCCAIDDLLTIGGVAGTEAIYFNAAGSHCNSVAGIMAACPLAPLVGQTPSGSLMNEAAFNTTEVKELEVFPNPAHGEVNVRFSRTAQTAFLRVTDLFGRVVFEKEMGEGVNQVQIDLGNGQFTNGIYLVSLLENGGVQTKQLVVQL